MREIHFVAKKTYIGVKVWPWILNRYILIMLNLLQLLIKPNWKFSTLLTHWSATEPLLQVQNQP